MVFEEATLDQGKMLRNHARVLWHEVRTKTAWANRAVSPLDSKRDRRKHVWSRAGCCTNVQRLSLVFWVKTTASCKLYGSVAKRDCHSSVAGCEGRTCNDGIDETAAARTARPAHYSPSPRPTRGFSFAYQVQFGRARCVYTTRSENLLALRRRGDALLQSRDRRHPVPTVARARVSGSYTVDEIRRRCRQPRAEISRYIHVTRWTDTHSDAEENAEAGLSWTEKKCDDKVAEGFEVDRSNRNRSSMFRVLSAARYITRRDSRQFNYSDVQTWNVIKTATHARRLTSCMISWFWAFKLSWCF